MKQDAMNAETVTKEESLGWIAEVFGESPDEITPETNREEIPNWDSLGVLTLMADLDEKFEISVSDKDLEAMTKVDDIIDCLRENGRISE